MNPVLVVSVGADHGGRARGSIKIDGEGPRNSKKCRRRKERRTDKIMQEIRKFDANGGGENRIREYGRERRGSIVYFSRCEPLSLQRRRMRRRWKRRVCVKGYNLW